MEHVVSRWGKAEAKERARERARRWHSNVASDQVLRISNGGPGRHTAFPRTPLPGRMEDVMVECEAVVDTYQVYEEEMCGVAVEELSSSTG